VSAGAAQTALTTATAPWASRRRRRWIWVLTALVTAAFVVLPTTVRVLLKADLQHDYGPLTGYRHQITGVQVRTGSGGVVMIRAGRPGRVTIEPALAWVFRKPSVSWAWHRGILRVSALCPDFNPFEDCQADLTITVPAPTAVQALAGPGMISVTGLTGPLHLAATSGMVQVSHVSGALWAQATSGGVAGRDVATTSRIYALVTSGHLGLRLVRRPQRLTLVAGTGTARVVLPPGSAYRIESSAGTGTVRVAPGISDPGSSRVIMVRVSAGHASIGYLAGTG
jgi:hypothetical protein